VLADLVRTDRQHHRPVAGDSQLAEAVKVLARAHQGLCWLRGRQVNLLRSTLREFYPGALHAFDELSHGDALAVLELAPTLGRGRGLSRSKGVSELLCKGVTSSMSRNCGLGRTRHDGSTGRGRHCRGGQAASGPR
jgi:hypothetical protein